MLRRRTERVILAPWRFHDFRRTLSTNLAQMEEDERLKYPQEVIEALLNHRSGKVSGVAGVDNRYKFMRERTSALLDWSRYVISLITPASQPLARAL